MANKPCEFIEHHNWKGKFVTDIWYDPNIAGGKYVSVVSDLRGIKFDSVEEAKAFLDKQMEDWSNGNTKES
jgi:hypothetical protein